ncbi:MAG: tetratricopeptide repeat protein [Fibrobacteres bacterium]|nr:tetratricopeptide repeat protein [Fibrobacterota bacterium]
MAARVSIWAKAALAIGTPLFVYSLCEMALWAAGVKPLSLTEDPFVGFAASQPLFIRGSGDSSGLMVTNPVKFTHFNPQSFPIKKAPGTFRIFTVGGSTCYGHPWRDPVSFSGWLRDLLPKADSSRKWEVINCGGISYASYREAMLIAEAIQYQPDLFLVYSGHNEFLEERTYRGTTGMPKFIRELSGLLEHTRTYSALRRLTRPRPAPAAAEAKVAERGARGSSYQMAGEVDDILANTVGPTSYTRNDTLRQDIFAHFRASLGRMADMAHSVGAEVIFLTTPGNEKDCSPFKSEPKPGLSPDDAGRIADLRRRAQGAAPAAAAQLLDSAAALDDRDAALLFEAGKAAYAAAKFADAKRLLRKSLDEDVCPLRAPTPLRDIVLKTASEHKAQALDFSALLEKKTRADSGNDVLGEPDFVDHVHLSIDDYRYMALAILGKMAALGMVKAAPGWDETAFKGNRIVDSVAARVMSHMGPRELGEGLHNLAKVVNWAGKHDDAARIAERALAVDTESLEAIWSSLFVGAARERAGREAEAIPHYRRAVRLDTTNPMSHHYLADALGRLGDRSGAASEYAKVVELDPGDADAQGKLGILLATGGRPVDAVPHLRAALNQWPDRADLKTTLGDALLKSGDAGEAESDFRAALARNPRDARALAGLAHIAEAKGDMAGAINLYAQALAIDPDLTEARAALSHALGGMPLKQ